MTTPPRIALWLIGTIVPAADRAAVLRDLAELYEQRMASHGPIRARLWCWRQVPAFATRLLAEWVRTRVGGNLGRHRAFSWIDLRLAIRMLVRFPGLTTISVAGMAVGIAIAVGAFSIVSTMLDPALPLPGGERIVSLVNWDTATNNREQRVTYDLEAWRSTASLEHVGAYRTVRRNLVSPDGQTDTVLLAEMSADGFDVAGIAPLMGRRLRAADEQADAPDVVLIGHDVWQRRFSGDPRIVGREVQLGAGTYAIVGVMPEGFAFPINHSYWLPWKERSGPPTPRTGPAINVFARLAPGATLDSAQAEIDAVTARLAAASPETHEHLRATVKRFAFGFSDMDDAENALALYAIQTSLLVLLLIVCVNVAILIYARTASRQGEIAVRTALGASRGRIVMQLFIEAAVLSSVAAAVGLGLVAVALREVDAAVATFAGRLPFWMSFDLSPDVAVFAVVLTIATAAVIGVIPALKATGRDMKSRLQGLSAGSGSQMQMGRVWTMLIVGQVGLSVALLPATMFHGWNSLRFRTGDLGFAVEEFLTADLVLDSSSAAPARDGETLAARFGDRQAELERRLEADPAVAGVAFSLQTPGTELTMVAEAEGAPPPDHPARYNLIEGSGNGRLVGINYVDPGFFATYDVPVLLGRSFQEGDAVSTSRPVLVSRTFAEAFFGADSPVGRRLRYVGRSREAGDAPVELDRWQEIVGVVEVFPRYGESQDTPRVYHPAAPGDLQPVRMAVRVREADAASFSGRLRLIAAEVDPALQVRNLTTLEAALTQEQRLMRLTGVTIAVVMLSVLMLSAAGIYALMSFTVARRRREIGIRAALGADPTRVLFGIFSRVFGQLALGAAIGGLAAVGFEFLLEGEMFQGRGAVILPLVALVMVVVGLGAAIGPARKGLRIEPTEALRAE